MMKKLYLRMLTFSLAMLPVFAWAETFTVNGINYNVTSSNTVEVTYANGTNTSGNAAGYTGAITIPATVKNGGVTYKVTAIAAHAMEYAGATSLSIGANVTHIGTYALANMGSLKKLTFAETASSVTIDCESDLPCAGEPIEEISFGRDIDFVSIDGYDRMSRCQFAGNLKKVTFGAKLTTINDYMLANQSNLASVTISSGVKYIGAYAFQSSGNSTEGQTITMGANVEEIGEYAFYQCRKLTSLTIPSKVTDLSAHAFEYAGLTSVTIPVAVTHIGDYAFANMGSLKKLTFTETTDPVTIDCASYIPFSGSPIEEISFGRDIDFVSTDGYDRTGRCQFDGALKKVTFGAKVTTINDYMFQGRSNLGSVTIGSGVKYIGARAFYESGNSTEGQTITMGTNVEEIGEYAFYRCQKLTSVTISSKVESLSAHAFEYAGLTSVTIPANVTHIGNYAFANMASLKKLTFAETTVPVTIDCDMYIPFASSPIEEISFGRDIDFVSIDDYDRTSRCQFNSALKKVTIGTKVTKLNDYMFQDLSLLSNVSFTGVKSIGRNAFCRMGKDDSVTEVKVSMGNNVETMGDNAFYGCSKLKSIALSTKLEEIPYQAFRATGLTTLTIPANVTTVREDAFLECDVLADITFADTDVPLTVGCSYNRPWGGNADKVVYVGRNFNFYSSDNYDRTSRRQFNNVTQATFGPQVTAINDYMFSENGKLTSITIGDNVETIGRDAFYKGASGDVEELTVTMGAKVESIGYRAFGSCSKLKSITLPSTLTTIRGSAFNSTGLTAITIPASVGLIEQEAFVACDALADITFEDGDTPLSVACGYNRPFGGNADKVLYLGRNFNFYSSDGYDRTSRRQFNNVKKATFGPKVTAISDYMFDGNTELTDLYVPWTTPVQVASNVFSSATYTTATLWVPGGTKEAYAAADVWKNFTKVDFRSFLFTLKSDNGGTVKLGTVSVKNGTKTTLVERGSDAVITLTPATGYVLNKVTVNGTDKTSSVSGGKLTISNVQAEASVVATFKLKTFTITKSSTTNGTITLSSTTVQYNKSYMVTLTPATGYELATVTVNGTDMTSQVVDGVLTVSNVKENQTVAATFQKKTYHVSITATGGQVTASTLTPKYQENVVLTIVEDEDSELQKLVVNGTDVTSQVSNYKYTITKVTGDVTVVATFRSNKEFITLADAKQVFSCTQDLDFTNVSGLKAYIAGSYDPETESVTMMQVKKVPAGTGVLLVGTKGTTYKVPYTTTNAVVVTFLKAVSATKTIPVTEGNNTNFLFETQNGIQAFYKADGTKKLTAGKAYLSVPTSAVAGVKSISVIIGETLVGIEDLDASGTPVSGDVYDLSGRKLDASRIGSGVYVVGGRKVVVRK